MLVCKTLTQNQNTLTVDIKNHIVTCKSIVVDPLGPTLAFDAKNKVIYTDYLVTGKDSLELGHPNISYIIDNCILNSSTLSTSTNYTEGKGKYYLSKGDPLTSCNTILYTDDSTSISLWRLDCTDNMTTTQPGNGCMRYEISNILYLTYVYHKLLFPEELISDTAKKVVEAFCSISLSGINYTSSLGTSSKIRNNFLNKIFGADSTTGTLDLTIITNNFNAITIKPKDPVARLYVDNTSLRLKVEAPQEGDYIAYYISKDKILYPNEYPDITKWEKGISTSLDIPLDKYLTNGLFKGQILLQTWRGDNSATSDSISEPWRGRSLGSNIVALPSGKDSLVGDYLLNNNDSKIEVVSSIDTNGKELIASLLCNPN